MELERIDKYYTKDIRYFYHVDENSLWQGQYEAYDGKHTLLEKGLFKDSVQIGLWLVDGIYKYYL